MPTKTQLRPERLPYASRSALSELRATIESERSLSAAASDRWQQLGRELRKLEDSPQHVPEAQLSELREQRRKQYQASTTHREAADRAARELAARGDLRGLLARLTSARLDELEDGHEIAGAERAAATQALEAHDAAREGLILKPSPAALERHDAARPALAREAERCAAIETVLEEALTEARATAPALEAAFAGDLKRAHEEHEEALQLLQEYLKTASRLAAILGRLQAIDQSAAGLRERAPYFQREDEVPLSANDAVRQGQAPLYYRDEVRLPGVDHGTIWPRP